MDTTSAGVDQQQGLSPKAMMLSSLAGCSGIDIVDILKKMKITDYDLKIVVEGELTDVHPKYYHTVAVNYYFSGANIDPKKCERAVQLSVDKYCGVMEMFRKFASVNTYTHFQSN
jgi:putative redox protein|tara:strand:- start:2 stop:346 length:345 start_codon:yes stop_codon:yes gene_type:complete